MASIISADMAETTSIGNSSKRAGAVLEGGRVNEQRYSAPSRGWRLQIGVQLAEHIKLFALLRQKFPWFAGITSPYG